MKDEAPSSPFTEFKPPCFEKYSQQLQGWQRVSFKLLASPLGVESTIFSTRQVEKRQQTEQVTYETNNFA